MNPSLSDVTKPAEIGGFARYLNALPEDRKLGLRKALEDAKQDVVKVDPEVLAQLRKDATNSTGATVPFGLIPYSLQAPALNLWPVVTKFRNSIPRRVIGGTGHHWKRITKIDTVESFGFVAEPTDTTAQTTAGRAGFMKWNEVDDSVLFATLGLDNYITFAAKYGGNTAVNSGMNFQPEEVVRLATLQATMMREEKAIIGANITALANSGMTPTLAGVTQAATGIGSLVAATGYRVQVTALTLLGVRAGSVGHGAVDAPGETDAAAFTTLTTATGGSAGDKSLSMTWPWKNKAVAYNVYVDTTTPKYQATVFTNYARITTTGGAGNVPNTADQTADANAYDGLIPLFVAKGGYVAQLGGATAQTWTSTPAVSGATNIDQFDAAFLSFFNTYNTGPQRIFTSATDKQKMTAAISGAAIASGTVPFLSFDAKGGDGNITGGISAGGVLNQYTGDRVQIVVHPYIPKGTAILWCDNLGDYYPDSKIPNPVEMLLQYDYMNVDWARNTLREEFGIYVNGAPALRAGFPMGIIQGAA